jgi:hypothetical protein
MEFKPTLMDRIYAVGFTRGFAEGFAKGLSECIEIIVGMDKTVSLLNLLVERRLTPAEVQLHMVASCTDEAQLDRWFERALTATSAEEVFAD